MAWADGEPLLKAVAKDINESYNRLAVDAGVNVVAVGDALLAGSPAPISILGTEGRDIISGAVNDIRRSANAIVSKWPEMMDVALAYLGTQLTKPSRDVKGNRPTNRRELLRQIREDMALNSRSIKARAVTPASEPAADDNGIIDRLTVDENGDTIEAGLHGQNVDVVIDSKPSQWRSVAKVRARNTGQDIFQLIGPLGEIVLEAVNDAFAGEGIVNNPALQQANSVTHLDAVTSLIGWALSGSATHQIDTSILFRSGIYTHRIYGTSVNRLFSQPLIVLPQHRRSPRNHKLAVYKTGSPTGNIVATWGSKTQTWTFASLSAGWNYLRPDRDKDLYPVNFDTPGGVLSWDIQCTTGDASNRLNVGFAGGQIYRMFDAWFYGHWSRAGLSQLYASKTFADAMSSAGKIATAIYLAYHLSAERDVAYLRSVGGGGETIADYT